MKVILNKIKNIIYYMVVAFLSFVIIFSLVRPGELINVIHVGWYKVVSQSMEPMIMVDDYIIAKKLDDASDLQDGDIIIFETYFYHQGSYSKDIVTHHFSHISEEGYIITYPHSQYGKDKDEQTYDTWYKSPSEPYFVTAEDLLGRHIETIPFHSGIKTVEFLFTRPIGITFTLIFLILIGYGVFYLYKPMKKEEKVEEIDADDLAYIFGNREE